MYYLPAERNRGIKAQSNRYGKAGARQPLGNDIGALLYNGTFIELRVGWDSS
jgi:hypothetical protein